MPKVPRHSERSEESRKRLATIGFGERRLAACAPPELRDLAQDRFHMRHKIVFWEELLLAGAHVF
jgi:hypothetical protein